MRNLDAWKLMRAVRDVRETAGPTAFVWLSVNGPTIIQWHWNLDRFARVDRHCKVIQENWIPTWQVAIRPLVGAPKLVACAKDTAPDYVIAPGKTRAAGG